MFYYFYAENIVRGGGAEWAFGEEGERDQTNDEHGLTSMCIQVK
jgi:hypothetical protein